MYAAGPGRNFYIHVLGLLERAEEKEAGKSWRKYLNQVPGVGFHTEGAQQAPSLTVGSRPESELIPVRREDRGQKIP